MYYKNDLDYVICLENGYNNRGQIAMYVDHFSDPLEDWFEEDREEVVSQEEH